MRAGWVGAETRGGRPGPSPSSSLPSFPSPPLPSPPLGSRGPRPASGLWAGVRRRQEGAGGSRAPAGRGEPTGHREPSASVPWTPPCGVSCSPWPPSRLPSMWVSGRPAPPCWAWRRPRPPRPRSRPPVAARQSRPRGRRTVSFRPTHGPLLPRIGCPTLPTPVWRPPPQHARTHLTHATHAALSA